MDEKNQTARIISEHDFDSILTVTITYVLVDLFVRAALIKILLLIFLSVLVILVLIQSFKPDLLQNAPSWLVHGVDHIIERIRIFPYESISILGVFYLYVLAIKSPYQITQSDRVHTTLLVILAFVFSFLANKAKHSGHHGFRSLWEIAIKPLFHLQVIARDGSSESTVSIGSRLPPNPNISLNYEQEKFIADNDIINPSATSTVKDEQEAHNSEWERSQDKRWKQWLEDEMQRLSGGVRS